ncbi:dephospho-CoA kinase [Neomegalonema perideroedes]|uniref:dephospho-CoA kinase n=1 Tax=Neomegalonema perideroedes TaxID=217219 RepID=UPI000371781E|nr:dephospho-CoA kinase [Neomegalonema perideroedes]
MTYRLGLTGSIGMGKSATAEMFRKRGIPVYDADVAVAELYAPGGGAAPVLEALIPGAAASDGSADREVLRKAVLGNPGMLKKLEAAIHPLVLAKRAEFLAANREAPLALLDIPLLYETGSEREMEAVLVVSAPAEVQRARVLARPGMTPERFEAILARQTPDAEKRARADWVLDTSRGFPAAEAEVEAILAQFRATGRIGQEKP